MKVFKIISIQAVVATMILSSCNKKLDTVPIDPKVTTSANVYNSPLAYKEGLAKLYASMAVSGQDINFNYNDLPDASDQGTACFLRELFNAEEVTTDECINAWGDGGLIEYHGSSFSDQNTLVKLMYERLFVNIAYCNEYIRDVNGKLGSLNGQEATDVTRYVAEARFMRAYFYYYAMNEFGNVPFATEKDLPATFIPKQIARADLFKYIESELVAIQPALAAPGANEYARVDQAADYALLSRMYLNAQVFTGTARYTDCITYANKIISSGAYSLHKKTQADTLFSAYQELFLADNNNDRDEIILPIAENGTSTESYGDVTFIIHASVGGSEDATNTFGIASGGWDGNRVTPSFVNKVFPDQSGNTDSRAIFYTSNQSLEVTSPNVFSQGYLCAKFKNVTIAGKPGSNTTFVDTDFPVFRLGEVYLNYTEAVLRGGSGGDMGTALGYINKLRERAYNGNSGDINASQLTLNFMIDERGRELYWEGFRRTDLIRFGLFTGGAYLWDFKGNVQAGAATDAHFNLFPLPASDLQENPNLKQNPGY